MHGRRRGLATQEAATLSRSGRYEPWFQGPGDAPEGAKLGPPERQRAWVRCPAARLWAVPLERTHILPTKKPALGRQP